MQIVFHTGAHLTDEDRLIKCLQRNREMLEKHDVNVPGLAAYRKWIRSAFGENESSNISAMVSKEVYESVVGRSGANRHIISNPGFFGTEKMSFRNGQFYRMAEHRIDAMSKLFPSAQLEMFMSIRNPASFLPTIYYKYFDLTGQKRLYENMLTSVRWSDFFMRIHQAFPDIPITVWCNEDTPVIWGKILQTFANINASIEFEGQFTLLNDILSEVGLEQFQSFMQNHKGLSEEQKQQVIIAFIEKFGREEALEQEIDLPNWNDELTDAMTETYEDDLERLAHIPNLNVILPDPMQ
ncbi:hypothetical protein ROA7450_02615 [Roseovarius albus]|uniref:Sulfotransferase family protein n=1 Tax=Roseovarius albus TaxID=1247867 RepID=A0A1X6ZIG6_9RHOB|nr:hypothetical protein [Roseovarius albus]SLN51813.1 hypothetical protein ROA7450_02615 [Roseovarius albus]